MTRTPRWLLLHKHGILVTWEFKPQDLWIGLYPRLQDTLYGKQFDVWICVVPCFPLHVRIGGAT